MATFHEQIQAMTPLLAGIGSQAGGDPAGIARGIALMQAKQERDQRKAAIDNMMAGMGISGQKKSFLASLPVEAQQQYILQQMAPKPRNTQVINGKVVDMDTMQVLGDFSDQVAPVPSLADMGMGGDGGGGFNVGGNVRMQGVSGPAQQAMNTFASNWTGPKVNITSAYRDKDYNAAVGGASGSQHIHGNAFDIDTRGWSLADKQAAVKTALASGFNGVGVYDNSLHFDVAGRRAWGPSYTNKDAPDWAKQMVAGAPAAQGGRVGPYRDAVGGAQQPAQAPAKLASMDEAVKFVQQYEKFAGAGYNVKQYEPRYNRMKGLIAQNQEAHAAAMDGPSVGAQKIFADGTIMQSTPQGPVVWRADGTKLTGQDAIEAVKAANEFEVRLANDTNYARRGGGLEAEADLGAAAAGATAAGKQGIDLAGKTFEALGPIQKNIANLTEVRDLINRGAETGPLAQYFPNITAASTELRNVQSRLGLDVVGSVAFGALSDAELKFALSSALPVGLDGPALDDWVARKIDAQEKLVGYLEKQAKFLSKSGNTLNDWLDESLGETGYAATDYSPQDIMKMTERDLVKVPIEDMNLEQIDALEARWQQIKAAK